MLIEFPEDEVGRGKDNDKSMLVSKCFESLVRLGEEFMGIDDNNTRAVFHPFKVPQYP
jgi:hypothetical protein